MSVIVEKLSKSFGDQVAVGGISFEAHPGEILGFLGPNGAGKSTTMKMISGFLKPDGGHIRVCNLDAIQQSIASRKKIGYLPEHNPLYLDMFIREFLNFSGGMYGMRGKRLGEKVEEMIKMVGLTPESNKKIGQLSKGFRQRVGLAQAMLHNPEVLILDEPTSGLDPNQILEIRELIRQLGKNKTVIFSTHIMQEVQALCQRVIIINKGTLVADEHTSDLRQRGLGHMMFNVTFSKQIELNDIKEWEGVTHISTQGDGSYRISSSNDIREQLFRLAVQKGVELLHLQREEQNLEDIFSQLTKS